MNASNYLPIVVVCAADNNYAMPLAVTIRSALANLSSNRRLLLFIIDGGITKPNKHRILKSLISEQCEVKWIFRPEAFDDKIILSDTLPSLKPLPNTAFYRLLISELIPQQYTKAIYLDCDLVVTEDLGNLWDIDIGENYLLAVGAETIRTVSHPLGLLNWKE